MKKFNLRKYFVIFLTLLVLGTAKDYLFHSKFNILQNVFFAAVVGFVFVVVQKREKSEYDMPATG